MCGPEKTVGFCKKPPASIAVLRRGLYIAVLHRRARRSPPAPARRPPPPHLAGGVRAARAQEWARRRRGSQGRGEVSRRASAPPEPRKGARRPGGWPSRLGRGVAAEDDKMEGVLAWENGGRLAGFGAAARRRAVAGGAGAGAVV